MKIALKSTYSIILVLTALTLSGCSSSGIFSSPYQTQMSPEAKTYLAQASQTQGIAQQRYQILAVNQLLLDNNLNDAQQLLNSLDRSRLDPTITQQKQILLAQLALKQNNPRLALTELRRVQNLASLPEDIKVAYYTTAISAHLRNNNLAYSTLARISLNNIQQNPDNPQEPIIWHNLQSLPLPYLQTVLNRSSSNLLRGWLQLAVIAKTNANQPDALVSAIENWQQNFPNHVANKLIPTSDVLDSLRQLQPPSQIALLLPLQGTYGPMGQAVRDGFMTAYYNAAKQSSNAPIIKVYDTSSNDDIGQVYQTAVNDGAQFVIGPLTQSNVESLAQNTSINIPTLALNYLSDGQTAPQNFIQLGLSPQQEVIQVANQALQHNVSNILIIYPQGDWGTKIKNSFESEWQQIGGQTIAELPFTTRDDLTTEITSVLHIDQSEDRINTLKQILREKIKATARRRQDVNGIVIIATPSQARQIEPLLRFYYAGDLPTFSISSIYSGAPNPYRDRDLNNIYFDDMPLLISQSPYFSQLRNQLKSLWATRFSSYSRLYGLGVDAYSLSSLLPRLTALPNFELNGVTGQLYLHDNQQIYRQLPWARFYRGVPKGV